MDDTRKSFVLRIVQPGLLGLMDGSVSTLAPLFAAAYATNSPRITFLIGLSAALGAGISMGFAEALSDTGVHTGRGNAVIRGGVAGVMTFLGGILHALPFLLPDIKQGLIWAGLVVGIELIIISYIRHHYFKTGFWLSVFQVVVGGFLVFLTGIIIGNA